MHRTEITAEVVRQADMMLTLGLDAETIAERLGITAYVVRVMAGDHDRIGRRSRPQLFTKGMVNPRRAVDATTIRMIQRMLDVGILRRGEIAREAGVSRSIVEQVASGRREAVSTARPPLCRGERFLRKPVRCDQCRAMISIVPCRACHAREAAVQESAGR